MCFPSRQHLLLGSSENIPLLDGKLTFGQWQRIFLVELVRSCFIRSYLQLSVN